MLIPKIQSRNDAFEILRRTSRFFYFLGAYAGLGFMYPTFLVAALFFLVYGFVIDRVRSRVVTVIFLVIVVAQTIFNIWTVVADLSDGASMGFLIFIGLLQLMMGMMAMNAAAKATAATFKIHEQFPDEMTRK